MNADRKQDKTENMLWWFPLGIEKKMIEGIMVFVVVELVCFDSVANCPRTDTNDPSCQKAFEVIERFGTETILKRG